MEEKILNLEVVATRWVAESIKEIVLRDVNGHALPHFSAGAHLRFQLALKNGVVERCYSLMEPRRDPYTYQVAVSRAQNSSGGSAFMCDEVREKSFLQALSPKNDFPIDPQANHHLLIAGGIGITPIYAMVKDLQEKGASMQLHYAARTPQSMAYHKELEALIQDQAHFYFDDGDPTKGIPLAAVLSEVSVNTHIYVCGPKPLIDSVRALAITKGLPESHIHFESFGGGLVSDSDAEDIEVHLAKSGKTLMLQSNESVLDMLLRNGCDLVYDCKRGECGVCAVSVIEGEVNHQDYVLEQTQKIDESLMCICVSRPSTKRLVLDL